MSRIPRSPLMPATLTEAAIRNEVVAARSKFPTNTHLLAALTEEVGELAQAYLNGEPIGRIRAEAVQVAAVAVRIIEEGDLAFTPAYLEHLAALRGETR